MFPGGEGNRDYSQGGRVVDRGHLLRDALRVEALWERDESDAYPEGGNYAEG